MIFISSALFVAARFSRLMEIASAISAKINIGATVWATQKRMEKNAHFRDSMEGKTHKERLKLTNVESDLFLFSSFSIYLSQSPWRFLCNSCALAYKKVIFQYIFKACEAGKIHLDNERIVKYMLFKLFSFISMWLFLFGLNHRERSTRSKSFQMHRFAGEKKHDTHVLLVVKIVLKGFAGFYGFLFFFFWFWRERSHHLNVMNFAKQNAI